MSRGPLKKFAARLRRKPNDAKAWLDRAAAALQAGDLEGARAAIAGGLQQGPHEPERLVAAAKLLGAAGGVTESERLLRQVIELHPERVDARAALARLLLAIGSDAAAVEEIDRAFSTGSEGAELHVAAALVHERRGDVDRAVGQLERLLDREPEHVEGNHLLAGLYDRLGNSAGAILCYRRVVAGAEGADELREALTSLGIALSSDGQHAEAVRILSDLAERHPGTGVAHANLGMALLEAGQLEQAVAAFRRVLELDPGSPQAHCGLGLAFQRQGLFTEAAEAFAATERLAPTSAVGPLNLGLALDARGDQEGARRALLRAAALDPDDLEIRKALERLLVVPAERERTAPGGPPAVASATDFDASISGDLRSFSLLDLLEFLRVQRKTGSLVVSSRHGAGLVRLHSGALTSASAPRSKRLGDALVERGFISRANLERAIAEAQGEADESAETLGGVLLRLRLIDRPRLERVVFDQLIAALEQLLGWAEGAFSFHPLEAEGPTSEPPGIAFDPQQVMLELMRRRDELSAPPRRPPPIPSGGKGGGRG